MSSAFHIPTYHSEAFVTIPPLGYLADTAHVTTQNPKKIGHMSH